MIIFSVGLQKSGSALMFNLLNDMVKATGGTDVRELKARAGLDDILKYHNCNLEGLSWTNLRRLLPLGLRTTFVVKTHSAPSLAVRVLLWAGLFRAVVIIRDPRDVIVSAMDHGRKIREEGRSDTFAVCKDVDSTLGEVRAWIHTLLPWLRCPNTLIVKYEDFVAGQPGSIGQVAAFLRRPLGVQLAGELAMRYDARNPDPAVRNHLHYNKARAHRYREALTHGEVEMINTALVRELEQLGYETTS